MALFNKGINCTPQCCFRDSHIETIEHLFMECEWAQSVWFVSPLGVNFSSTTAPAKSFVEWLEHIILYEDVEIIQNGDGYLL